VANEAANRENSHKAQIDKAEMRPSRVHEKRCDDEVEYGSEPDRGEADGDVEVARLALDLQIVFQCLECKRMQISELRVDVPSITASARRQAP